MPEVKEEKKERHWKTATGLCLAILGIGMEFVPVTKPMASEVRMLGWSLMGFGAAYRLIKK